MLKSDKNDYYLSFAILFPIVLLMLQQLLLGLNFIPNEIIRTYNIILSSIPLIISFKIVVNRNLRLVAFSYIIVTILLLISYNNYNNREYLLDEFFFLMFVSIPIFLSCSSIRKIEILKDVLLKVAFYILIIGVLLFILILIGKVEFTSYSMALSYYLLIPSLVFVYQRKNIYYLFSIISLIFILLLGSRGPFLIALLYYIILVVLNLKFNSFKSYILIIFIVFISVLLLNIDPVFLFNFIEDNLGINSRTLRFLIEGDITYSSDRDSITQIIINNISNSSLFGYGIYGDRAMLDGTYAHNLILEILIHFGVVLGSLILLFFIIFITKVFISSNDKELVLLFLFLGFLPLLVSGSYLRSIEFSILIGYLILINKKKHGYKSLPLHYST